MSVDGAEVTVNADQVEVIETPLTGWQVSTDGPFSCSLDVTLDQALRVEGLARELARLVNDLRKRSGLQRGDRIALEVTVENDPDGEIATMLEQWHDRLAGHVGAGEITVGGSLEGEPLAVGRGQVCLAVQPVKPATSINRS